MRRARCRHGCGRATARGFCGPIRSAPDCSARPTAPRSPSKIFGPADPHRRQVAQLAGRLPPTGAVRLERLRGFGAALGTLITCGCARLEFADGSHGILVAAAEPVGRAMPLVERLQRLVEGIDTPIAAFARDGMFVGASDAARSLLGFRNLSEAGLDDARDDALKQGRAETPIGIGHMVLQRVGSGADVGLVALIAPGAGSRWRDARCRERCRDHRRSPGRIRADRRIRGSSRPIRSPHHGAADSRLRRSKRAPMAPIRCRAGAGDPAAAGDESASRAFAFVEAVADEPMPRRRASKPATILAASPSHRHLTGSTSPAECAPSPAALHVADGCRRPLLARLRRIHPPDRRAHRRRASAGCGARSPRRSGSIPKAASPRRSPRRDTWSGITLNWPVDGGGRLPVELSGLPVYDRAHNFAGYRGFGVCRDLDGLTRLAALRRHELLSPRRFRRRKRCRPTSSRRVPALGSCPPNATLHLNCRHRPAETSTTNRFGNCRGNSRGNARRNARAIDPGNAQERAAVSADRRTENAGADAGGKQRLQRTRPAIVGTARQRERRRPRRRRRPIRPEAVVDQPAAPDNSGTGRRSNRHGWRVPSRPRAAKPGATRRCSICCPSAS